MSTDAPADMLAEVRITATPDQIAAGKFRTLCPHCSAMRRHHRRKPVLVVVLRAGGVVWWRCLHCGWSGERA